MKNVYIHYIAIIFSLLLQSSNADTEKPLSVNNTKYPHPYLVMLDFNEDGKLSFVEFKNSPRLLDIPVKNARVLFQRFDKNANGLIEEDEFPVYQRHVPDDIKPWSKDRVSKMDVDEDGYVSYEEFIQADYIKEYNVERQRVLFQFYDKNDDEKLSAMDYYLKRHNVALKEGDTNKDEKLSFDEFRLLSWHVWKQQKAVREIFDRGDTNKDGFITLEDDISAIPLKKMTLKL